MGSPLSKLVIGILLILNPMIVFSTEIRRLPQQIPSALEDDEFETEEEERRRMISGIMSAAGGMAHKMKSVVEHHKALTGLAVGTIAGGTIGAVLKYSKDPEATTGEIAKAAIAPAAIAGTIGGIGGLLWSQLGARRGRRLINYAEIEEHEAMQSLRPRHSAE